MTVTKGRSSPEISVPPPAPQKRRRRGGMLWLMTPMMIFIFLIIGIPMAIVIITSFLNITESNLVHWLLAPFTGLSNYASAPLPFTSQTSVPACPVFSVALRAGHD
jgi:ABC-type sugar transport system permease subunit